MREFKLPDVGEGIHEAEILQWLVKVGDTVEQDQPILEVQTDKAVVEIPSPVAGTIAEIRTEAGTLAHVGDILVVIAPTTGLQTQPDTPATNSRQVQAKVAPTPARTPGIDGPGRRVLAAPAVRKLARELDVDLAKVSGSGPAGRILPDDVRRFVEQKPTVEPGPVLPTVTEAAPAPAQPVVPAAPPPPPRQLGQEQTDQEPLQGLRRRIAERMALAWQIPHVTSFEDVDATNLVTLRQHLKAEAERRGVRLTYLPLIIKATLQALKEFPYFNASLDLEQKKIMLHRHYHIGVATAVSEGLLVPVIRHADQMSALQLAQELSRLAALAQERKLSQQELSGSTFTITNFGSFGGRQGTPIINPPEVAILGCGRIEDKPIVAQGQIEIRPMLPLALSYDHRLIDGAAAGAFLERLKGLLVDPSLLFLELV